MWIVHQIVNEHNGRVYMETESGEFTRFHIDLPAAPPAA